jgi:hypothetical protein
MSSEVKVATTGPGRFETRVALAPVMKLYLPVDAHAQHYLYSLLKQKALHKKTILFSFSSSSFLHNLNHSYIGTFCEHVKKSYLGSSLIVCIESFIKLTY